MCEPVSLSLMAVAAASGGAGIIGANGQRQAAKGAENQQRIATEYQIAENRQRASTDYIATVKAEQMKQSQEKESMVVKSHDVAAQADLTAARGEESAAERSVAGRSVEQVVADYHVQANQEIGRLHEQQNWRDVQHSFNLQGDMTTYNNRASSIAPYVMKPQAPVDFINPILGVATAGLSGGRNTGALGDLFKSFLSPSTSTPKAASLTAVTPPSGVASSYDGYGNDGQDG